MGTMRGFVVAVVLVTACRFTPGSAGTGDGQPSGDSGSGSDGHAPPADASRDAFVFLDAPAPCDVRVPAPDGDVDQVGANGGTPDATLACTGNDVIVGVAVRMSNGNTANGSRSALGFTIACAPLTITSTGPVVGAETTFEVMGAGNFGWSPATQSAVTHCAPGSILSGLEAYRASTDNEFLAVTITCSDIGIDGAPTGTTHATYVTGSLTSSQNQDSAACEAGTVVRRVKTRTGSGFDAATPACAATSCAP
jgi:hypothetical protein